MQKGFKLFISEMCSETEQKDKCNKKKRTIELQWAEKHKETLRRNWQVENSNWTKKSLLEASSFHLIYQSSCFRRSEVVSFHENSKTTAIKTLDGDKDSIYYRISNIPFCTAFTSQSEQCLVPSST